MMVSLNEAGASEQIKRMEDRDSQTPQPGMANEPT